MAHGCSRARLGAVRARRHRLADADAGAHDRASVLWLKSAGFLVQGAGRGTTISRGIALPATTRRFDAPLRILSTQPLLELYGVAKGARRGGSVASRPQSL